MKKTKYIERNPKICGGTPCFRGTRIPVYTILYALGAGDSIDRVLEGYPSLTRKHILAAFTLSGGILEGEILGEVRLAELLATENILDGKMTTTEKKILKTISQVASKGERMELYSRGKGVIGIVPFDEVKLLEQLDDLVLGEKARKSLKEKGGITLEQLRKKLKL